MTPLLPPDAARGLAQDGYSWQAGLATLAEPDVPVAHEVRIGDGEAGLLLVGQPALRLFDDRERLHPPVPLRPQLHRSQDGALTRFGPRLRADYRHLFEPSAVELLRRAFDDALSDRIPRWMETGRIDLHQGLSQAVTDAAFSWLGVGVSPDERDRCARELTAVVADGSPAAVCDRVARHAIRRARSDLFGNRPLRVIALATDDGVLPPDEETVDDLVGLLTLLVGTAWLGAFVPVALLQRLDWLPMLGSDGDQPHRVAFVHEVRRHYPFTAVLGARARTRFRWYGRRVHEGQPLLLHVSATDHDPTAWTRPQEFSPERFLRDASAAERLAEGAGVGTAGLQRSAGAPAVAQLLLSITSYLPDLAFAVATPPRFSRGRIPALPDGGPCLLVGRTAEQWRSTAC